MLHYGTKQFAHQYNTSFFLVGCTKRCTRRWAGNRSPRRGCSEYTSWCCIRRVPGGRGLCVVRACFGGSLKRARSQEHFSLQHVRRFSTHSMHGRQMHTVRRACACPTCTQRLTVLHCVHVACHVLCPAGGTHTVSYSQMCAGSQVRSCEHLGPFAPFPSLMSTPHPATPGRPAGAPFPPSPLQSHIRRAVRALQFACWPVPAVWSCDTVDAFNDAIEHGTMRCTILPHA